MQNDEHKGIKYLMKELDPSEAVLFEQRMMEDEELLEEVECMRRTLRQLEKLPLESPPHKLTEQIVRKACSKCDSSSSLHILQRHPDKSFTKYYAAAALILVGVGMGLMSMQYSDSGTNSTTSQKAVSTAEFSGSGSLKGIESLRPWFKKNNAIYINQPTEGRSDYLVDSTLHENIQNLQRQQKQSFINDHMSNGSVNLTGSGR